MKWEPTYLVEVLPNKTRSVLGTLTNFYDRVFAKIVIVWKPEIFFAKCFILDNLKDPEYASEDHISKGSSSFQSIKKVPSRKVRF